MNRPPAKPTMTARSPTKRHPRPTTPATMTTQRTRQHHRSPTGPTRCPPTLRCSPARQKMPTWTRWCHCCWAVGWRTLAARRWKDPGQKMRCCPTLTPRLPTKKRSNRYHCCWSHLHPRRRCRCIPREPRPPTPQPAPRVSFRLLVTRRVRKNLRGCSGHFNRPRKEPEWKEPHGWHRGARCGGCVVPVVRTARGRIQHVPQGQRPDHQGQTVERTRLTGSRCPDVR